MRAALITLLLMVSLPSLAIAEPGGTGEPRVALLETSFSDDMLPPLRERIMERILGVLRERGLGVIEPADIERTLAPLGPSLSRSCRAGQCIPWVLEALDADAGMTVTVNAIENSYTISLIVVGAFGGQLDRSEARCDICTFDELIDNVGTAAEALELDIPHRIRAGHLGITTSPVGAQIHIDGIRIGVSSLIVPLPPGRHLVEALLEGAGEATEEIEVIAERTTNLRLVLGQVPGSEPERSRRWIEPVLVASVALGVALTIAGAILVGLDSACLEDLPEGGCARSWETQQELGAGLLGGGVAVSLTAGLGLILRAIERD